MVRLSHYGFDTERQGINELELDSQKAAHSNDSTGQVVRPIAPFNGPSRMPSGRVANG